MAVELGEKGLKWWFSLAPSLEGKATEYSLYLCQVCAFNCSYFFKQKPRSFPFGIIFTMTWNFTWEQNFLKSNRPLRRTKPYLQCLGLTRKKLPQKASTVLLNCLFQLPFPRAFVPSVAKCWKWHLHDHRSEHSSPRPSLGCCRVTSVGSWTWSWYHYVTASNLVASLNQLL